ncbi:Uncharacterised protein [Fusobacterium necrophorum subsp. necrophorum]|nr:Uncharacterised protein [Fusobacterium necrophorum subsp. necrophorum]
MKEVNLTDLNDVFYLENQGLYEIDRDIVTEQKEGYDLIYQVLVSNFQITMKIYMFQIKI